MIQYSKELHRQLLDGKRNAIGWGLSGDLIYQLKKSPYPFHSLIDGQADPHPQINDVKGVSVSGSEILIELDPEQTVIIVFADINAFGEEIVNQIKEYGAFDVTLPFCFWQHEEKTRMEQLLTKCLEQNLPVESPVNPKRIALWIHALSKGGAERQMVLLALGLRGLGYEVDLITAYKDHPKTKGWSDQLCQAGVNRYVIPDIRQSYGKYWCDNSKLNNEAELLQLFTPHGMHQINSTVNFLCSTRPVAAISYLDDGNITLGISATIAKIPTIILSGRSVPPCYFSMLNNFLIPKDYLRHVYRELVKRENIVLANNSSYGAKRYSRWLNIDPNDIKVIPNAVEKPHSQQRNIKREYAIDNNDIFILGVMRLSEEKRPSLFIDVLAQLDQRGVSVKTILIGDGPQRKSVIEQIAENRLGNKVYSIGDQETVADFMNCADILLHTSRLEGIPNVLLEAQASGLPIIATNVGGSEEAVLPELREFYLIDTDNPSLLADAVEKILGSQKRQRTGLVGKKVLDLFSVQALAKNTVSLI